MSIAHIKCQLYCNSYRFSVERYHYRSRALFRFTSCQSLVSVCTSHTPCRLSRDPSGILLSESLIWHVVYVCLAVFRQRYQKRQSDKSLKNNASDILMRLEPGMVCSFVALGIPKSWVARGHFLWTKLPVSTLLMEQMADLIGKLFPSTRSSTLYLWLLFL